MNSGFYRKGTIGTIHTDTVGLIRTFHSSQDFTICIGLCQSIEGPKESKQMANMSTGTHIMALDHVMRVQQVHFESTHKCLTYILVSDLL